MHKSFHNTYLPSVISQDYLKIFFVMLGSVLSHVCVCVGGRADYAQYSTTSPSPRIFRPCDGPEDDKQFKKYLVKTQMFKNKNALQKSIDLNM